MAGGGGGWGGGGRVSSSHVKFFIVLSLSYRFEFRSQILLLDGIIMTHAIAYLERHIESYGD